MDKKYTISIAGKINTLLIVEEINYKISSLSQGLKK